MNTATIPGGAFQSADGSWHDANGRPLSKEQIAEAEKLAAEQGQRIAEAEAKQQASLLARDPAVQKAFAAFNLIAPAQPEPAPAKPQSEPVGVPKKGDEK